MGQELTQVDSYLHQQPGNYDMAVRNRISAFYAGIFDMPSFSVLVGLYLMSLTYLNHWGTP
jgi:hypothetical protein